MTELFELEINMRRRRRQLAEYGNGTVNSLRRPELERLEPNRLAGCVGDETLGEEEPLVVPRVLFQKPEISDSVTAVENLTRGVVGGKLHWESLEFAHAKPRARLIELIERAGDTGSTQLRRFYHDPTRTQRHEFNGIAARNEHIPDRQGPLHLYSFPM